MKNGGHGVGIITEMRRGQWGRKNKGTETEQAERRTSKIWYPIKTAHYILYLAFASPISFPLVLHIPDSFVYMYETWILYANIQIVSLLKDALLKTVTFSIKTVSMKLLPFQFYQAS